MIRKVLSATALIIGDAIEEWATRVSRADLLRMIEDQQARIWALEEELDLLKRERDPGIDCPPEERAEDGSGFKSYDPYDLPSADAFCDECGRLAIHCNCPF